MAAAGILEPPLEETSKPHTSSPSRSYHHHCWRQMRTGGETTTAGRKETEAASTTGWDDQ